MTAVPTAADFTAELTLAVPVLDGLLHRVEEGATWAELAPVLDRLGAAVARRDAADLRAATATVQVILSDRAGSRAGVGLGVPDRDGTGAGSRRRTIPEPMVRIIESIVASSTEAHRHEERPAQTRADRS